MTSPKRPSVATEPQAAGQPADPTFREYWEAADADDWQARSVLRRSRQVLVGWSDAWTGLLGMALDHAGLDPEEDGVQDIVLQLDALRDRVTDEVIWRIEDWLAAPATGWLPTVEDIQRGVVDHGRGDTLLDEAVAEFADIVDCTRWEGDELVQDDAPWHLWVDLRPSEARRLQEIMDDARERASRHARRVILADLAAGAREFAREFPDARRPEAPAV